MINMFKRMQKSDKGFTLVELLVVMLILAILAVAAVAAFLSQQDKARESAARQKLDLAFKAAKAEAVFNDGNFTGGSIGSVASLADDIESAEPTLVTVGVATSAGGATVEDQVYIDSDGTSGGDLILYIDPEGNEGVVTLTVAEANGTPSYS